jgi:hypothetical protein
VPWLACSKSAGPDQGNDSGPSPSEVAADQNATPELPSEADGGAGPAASGLGSPCDILTDAGATQGVYNSSALECPSYICLKPGVQPGVVGAVNTAAFCTAGCTQDSDCAGQTGDPANALDTRCKSGFLCGVAFAKGKICCQKLCLCKDFLGPTGAPTPLSCMDDAGCQ